MSTLLEALKKSERARRLVRTPTYREVGAPPVSWALRSVSLIAIVTLVVVLLWSGWIMMRRPAPAPASTPGVVPGASSEAPQEQPASSPVASAPAAHAPEPPPTSSARETAHSPVVAAKPSVPATRASEPPAVLKASDTPWLSELPAGVRERLPPLVVNIHVYSPNASQRILYINNRPCQPGQEIDGGVVVEDILPDGVLLRFENRYFRLPRPT